MADETTTKGRWKAIIGALISVLIGAGFGWIANNEPPEPLETTCDVAAAIMASEACADDEPEPDPEPADPE